MKSPFGDRFVRLEITKWSSNGFYFYFCPLIIFKVLLEWYESIILMEILMENLKGNINKQSLSIFYHWICPIATFQVILMLILGGGESSVYEICSNSNQFLIIHSQGVCSFPPNAIFSKLTSNCMSKSIFQQLNSLKRNVN